MFEEKIPEIIATIEEAMKQPEFESGQNKQIIKNFRRYCRAYNVPSVTFNPKFLNEPKAEPKAHLTKETIKELLFSDALAKTAFELVKHKVPNLEILALEIIAEQAPEGFIFSAARQEFAAPSGAGYKKISPCRLFNVALLLEKVKQ